jgi:long-chain acyl-CoA synthetase
VNQAIGKIGAAQVAVNWKLTPVESRYIVEDSEATAVIYDDETPELLYDAWQDLALKLMVSVELPENSNIPWLTRIIEQADSTHIETAQPPRLILYTSGTTGKPKGAVPNLEKLAGNMQQVMEYMASVGGVAPAVPDARGLLALPMHHGAGPAAASQAMTVGGQLHLMRKYDPVEALKIISEHKITNWIAVPTMLNRIAALPKEVLEQFDVSSMQVLNLGASAVPFSLKQWVVGYFGDHCLYEGYGSTETGMITSMTPKDQLRKPGSSGKPYRHVDIRILDDNGNPLAAGETGEIWVKTPVAIDRYLNRDALDAETLSSDGYFRVGDVGHLDEEGYLFITDRKKDMIVAGGVNIYPAEIEAVLIKHPNIIEAAVIGIPHDDFGEQVMAVCEVSSDAIPEQDELLAFCRAELAGYKLPRKVTFVEELPRNPMGKVLKNELRMPYWEGRERKI